MPWQKVISVKSISVHGDDRSVLTAEDLTMSYLQTPLDVAASPKQHLACLFCWHTLKETIRLDCVCVCVRERERERERERGDLRVRADASFLLEGDLKKRWSRIRLSRILVIPSNTFTTYLAFVWNSHAHSAAFLASEAHSISQGLFANRIAAKRLYLRHSCTKLSSQAF